MQPVFFAAPRTERLPLAVLGAALLLAACSSVGQPAQPGIVQSASTLSSFRVAQGLRPLLADPVLEKAAAQQAGFMADAGRMEHKTAFGRDFGSRMRANGVTGPRAENVAHAGDSATAFGLWEKSPPHRRNMLAPRFSHYGLASAPDGRGKRYWALVLGR